MEDIGVKVRNLEHMIRGNFGMAMRNGRKVANLEETITGVLSHIGVEFDPACLEFYNVRRITITPSADQVRKPIYTSSVGRHKHFEKHIGILSSLK